MKVSLRSSQIEPSITLEIAAKAAQLRAEGRPVLSFSAGEPDFPTPEPICRAAERAIEAGRTRYTPTPGEPQVREALAGYLAARKGVDVEAGNIVLTAGVKSGVYLSLLGVIDPGDEVLGIAPFWVTYPWATRIAGGSFRAVPAGPGMRPDVDAVRAAIGPRTKALLINSPNNPSGVVYTQEEIHALVQLCAEKGLWLLSDEIYEDLVFGDAKHFSPLSAGPEALENVILLSGFSKSYAMTGWRAGYVVGPKHLTKTISGMLSHLAGNVATPTQYAIWEATKSGGPYLAKMREEFDRRRLAMVEGLRSIDGITCPEPEGAFYVLANVSAHLGDSFPDDPSLALALLEECNVAAVPGAAFDAPGHLRFSYANSLENIREGVSRTRAFFEKVGAR